MITQTQVVQEGFAEIPTSYSDLLSDTLLPVDTLEYPWESLAYL
jgi:hypothetical protein